MLSRREIEDRPELVHFEPSVKVNDLVNWREEISSADKRKAGKFGFVIDTYWVITDWHYQSDQEHLNKHYYAAAVIQWDDGEETCTGHNCVDVIASSEKEMLGHEENTLRPDI